MQVCKILSFFILSLHNWIVAFTEAPITADWVVHLSFQQVLHQDILSRKHIIENLGEKAQALTKATPSAKVNKFVGELHSKYEKICELSKSVLDRFEHAMKEHQQYQDASHDFQDWLNASREKLDMCADRSGDKMSLQAKRERLKVGVAGSGDCVNIDRSSGLGTDVDVSVYHVYREGVCLSLHWCP